MDAEENYSYLELTEDVTATVQRLWGDRKLSDIVVTFRFPDEASKTFHLHKFLLQNSEYFKACLSGSWRGIEKKEVQVDVEDPLAELAAIEAVLEALYAHRVDVTEFNVLGLIAASAFLGVPKIYAECKSFIEQEVDIANVVSFCNFAVQSEYPVSDAIVERCVNFLTVRAFDDARDLLPELPLPILKTLFLSNGLWVPTETDKFDLIVETFIAKHKQEGEFGTTDLEVVIGEEAVYKFGHEHGELTDALVEVLASVQYMHMGDKEFIRIRKCLHVAENPCFLAILERHAYNQKVLFMNLQKLQLPLIGEEYEEEDEDPEPLVDNDGWFYFAAELEDAMGFLESRKREPSEETGKIYYGGSDWSVGFVRQRDRSSCHLSVAIHRSRPCLTGGSLYGGPCGGSFVDKRPSVEVEMKVMCDNIVREDEAVIGDGGCYVFSGYVAKHDLNKYFVTYDDNLRIMIGLRLV